MTSYLYFKCGCEFNIDDGDWDCDNLCNKHRKELCEEDLEVD